MATLWATPPPLEGDVVGLGDRPSLGRLAHLDRQESQIFGREKCSNVSHPLGVGTRRAYAVLARVARANPDAVLPDPDFPDAERVIGEKASGVAEVIRYCLAEVATEGPGWRALADRLDEAAALRGPLRALPDGAWVIGYDEKVVVHIAQAGAGFRSEQKHVKTQPNAVTSWRGAVWMLDSEGALSRLSE